MGKSPEKKKAISIKNILLGLSLTLYAVFLVWGIINCIVHTIKSKCLDLFTILEPVVAFWEKVWFEFDIWCVLISLFAIVYPIYYLIDRVTRKSENQPADVVENKKVSKLFILFLLSFLPYLLMGYFSIFGMDFGLFSNTYMIYGFDALIIVLITCSVLPIYPVALIFQIVYLIKQYKKLTKKSKLITKYTIIAVVAFTLLPSLIYMALEKL